MRFLPEYDISRLRPAPYNPRQIDDESFAALVESIQTLGVLRPAIATDKRTILAGHQRTKAMMAAGLTEAPVFLAEHEVSKPDELRFNQLHNAVDTEDPSAPVRVPPGEEGWATVDAWEISGTDRVGEPVRKTSLAKMLMVHGPWSNVIATESGRVLVGSIYAAASVGLNLPVLVRYVPEAWAETVLRCFGREYGEFNYDNVPRDQWQQASQQPKRKPGEVLAEGSRKPGSFMQSAVWTLDVIPRLRGDETIFELGSGRGAYAEALRCRGFRVIDIEFYRHKARSFDINHAVVQRSIDEFCEHVATKGRFDVVVLDSVLNSVGSLEGQAHVLTLLNAVAKRGALIAMSGKSIENARRYRQGTNDKTYMLRLEDRSRFFDKHGQTAIYSRGGWYFQKYHELDEVREIAREYIGPRYWLYNQGKKRNFTRPDHGTESTFRSAEMWQLSGYIDVEPPAPEAIEAAVRYEFELPYPSGRTVGRSEDVLAAMREGGIL